MLGFGLLFLVGCSDVATAPNYTVPTQQKVVAPIEQRINKEIEVKKVEEKKVEEKKEVDVPLSNDNHYINTAGNEVHSPAFAPSQPAGASARCRDGSYSFSQSRRGTCSHHGGVEEWF